MRALIHRTVFIVIAANIIALGIVFAVHHHNEIAMTTVGLVITLNIYALLYLAVYATRANA
jgi:hypothetical protein